MYPFFLIKEVNTVDCHNRPHDPRARADPHQLRSVSSRSVTTVSALVLALARAHVMSSPLLCANSSRNAHRWRYRTGEARKQPGSKALILRDTNRISTRFFVCVKNMSRCVKYQEPWESVGVSFCHSCHSVKTRQKHLVFLESTRDPSHNFQTNTDHTYQWGPSVK